MKRKTRSRIGNLLSGIVLFAASISMLFPFFWMVKTALMPNKVTLNYPPKLLELPIVIDNFVKVLRSEGMTRSIFNSFFIAVVSTAGVLFFCSIAAYAFSKIRFRHSGFLFGAIFATMLIPSQILLIPMYVIFAKIHWVDTFLPLIVPQILINGYGVFLLRQFMVGIPDSYIEAAKLDGLGHFGIYARIMLPLCKPPIITLGVFTFIGNWNNFFGALIYLDSEKNFTLPLVMNVFRTQYTVEWGTMMAGATLTVLPLIVIYLFAQKSFIEGIAMTGVKG
ncbi:MAG: carbohydrate ABC transporter permease [Oscillospiraceae bacterium]|nr:carbohydrate ABC transporter permease [Oscillospiraceae bacterium]